MVVVDSWLVVQAAVVVAVGAWFDVVVWVVVEMGEVVGGALVVVGAG
jgi:hypothetical protein